MGAGESKKDKVVGVEEIKIEHEKFKHFVYHEQSDQLEIKMDMYSQKDYTNWVTQLAKLNQFQEKQTLLLPVKHQYTNKGLCGNAGTLKIFYENYPYLFQEEIDNRIEMNKHFQEEQLWYLLYSLTSSSAEFGKINTKVGDIRPYNIFINEEGQIKIANLYSWPYEKTNFDKTAFEKTLTYLAPEQIRLISKGAQDNTANRITAESFSIGLTLLQAGLLFNAKDLYSISNFTIDLDFLNRKIKNWLNLEFTTDTDIHRRYSPLLRNIVAGLCHADQRERLTSVQVEEILRPYQNEILNLREFDHRNVRLPGRFQYRESYHEQVNRGYSPNRQVVVEQEYREGPRQVVFPQQTIVMNRPPEVRVNTSQPPTRIQYVSRPPSQSPPPEPVRPVGSQSPQREYVRPVSSNNQVRFNTGETVYIHQGQRVTGQQYEVRPQSIPVGGHMQQFNRYAAPTIYQPQPQRVQGSASNSGGLQQFFNQYATMNQNNEQRDISSTINFRSTNPTTTYTNGNTLNNYNSTTFNTRQWQAPVKVENTTVTQFSKPYTSMNAQVVTSIGGSGEGSDFLKKIDEQLQASRKQFPSR